MIKDAHVTDALISVSITVVLFWIFVTNLWIS